MLENFLKTVYIKYSKIAIFVGFEGKIFGKIFFLLLKISVGILFLLNFLRIYVWKFQILNKVDFSEIDKW